MIKAEVISHEGNPGPNWLDRCRTLATPTNITVVVVIAAIIGISAAVNTNDGTESASSPGTTQTVSPARPLSVEPVTAESYQSINGNANVQSAVGGAGNVGPNNTQQEQSQLNNTATTPDASQKASGDQGSLRGRSLTNKLQSAAPSIDKSLKKLNANQKKNTKR